MPRARRKRKPKALRQIGLVDAARRRQDDIALGIPVAADATEPRAEPIANQVFFRAWQERLFTRAALLSSAPPRARHGALEGAHAQYLVEAARPGLGHVSADAGQSPGAQPSRARHARSARRRSASASSTRWSSAACAIAHAKTLA